MHELSLCNAIADTVTDHAGDRAVRSVRLRVGHFRQVVPDTLRFCWSARIEGTALAGSELEVVEVPAIVRCAGCGDDTTLDVPVLRCGSCGSRDVELISGEEFLIESIEVGDDAVAGEVR